MEPLPAAVEGDAWYVIFWSGSAPGAHAAASRSVARGVDFLSLARSGRSCQLSAA